MCVAPPPLLDPYLHHDNVAVDAGGVDVGGDC